jgi:hypothetical protein
VKFKTPTKYLPYISFAKRFMCAAIKKGRGMAGGDTHTGAKIHAVGGVLCTPVEKFRSEMHWGKNHGRFLE